MNPERIIEPIIPASEVKKAVLRPSSSPGIDWSRLPVSNDNNPIVIP